LKISAQSLSDRAYQELEQLIATLELAPGAPVSEPQLSRLLGIGRTPIREALQRLSREHMVEIVPNRGIFVTEVNPRKQLLVLETRRELERLVCTRAARRSTSAERAEFKRIAGDFRRAAKGRDDQLFLEADKALNDRTIVAARNEFAASALASLHGISRRFWFGNMHRYADLVLAAKLHACIAEEIARGDEAGAAEAVDRLLDYIEAFTRKTIGIDGGARVSKSDG